ALDTGRARGLHGWPGPRPDAAGGSTSTWLHVSAGMGTSMYAPVRFACRPEVSLLQLVARPGEAEWFLTARREGPAEVRARRRARLSWPGSRRPAAPGQRA